MTSTQRILINALEPTLAEPVLIRGWIYRLRELSKTTFIVVRDCTGEIQCVADSAALRDVGLKLDEPVEIVGKVRADKRARAGFEVDVLDIAVLNAVGHPLPFNASSDIADMGSETLLNYRPLALRNIENTPTCLKAIGRTLCPQCCRCLPGNLGSAWSDCNTTLAAPT